MFDPGHLGRSANEVVCADTDDLAKLEAVIDALVIDDGTPLLNGTHEEGSASNCQHTKCDQRRDSSVQLTPKVYRSVSE